MKRKIVLKIMFILFLSAFFSQFLWSEEKNANTEEESSYQLSAGISAGMLFGTSFELVYKTPDLVGSELQWEMKPLFYLGPFVEFSQKDPLKSAGFYAKLGLKLGIPAESGFMEDRDWLALENKLSHFSSSTNFTDSAVLLDLLLGVSIPLFSTIVITPLAAFNYMHYEWSARDGYAQYAKDLLPWDESIPKTYFKGTVAAYTQDWFIGSFGLSVKYPFLKRFLVEAHFLYSPLILAYAEDDHFFRNAEGIHFTDDLRGGYLLEPALSFSFFFDEKMSLSFRSSYRYIHDTKGYSSARDIAEDVILAKSIGGAEYEVWDIGINFQYSF